MHKPRSPRSPISLQTGENNRRWKTVLRKRGIRARDQGQQGAADEESRGVQGNGDSCVGKKRNEMEQGSRLEFVNCDSGFRR